MIPSTSERQLVVNGAKASTSFGISVKDSAHVMSILRDTLYSDKILAVLREYGANAWDAHREAGKGSVPISVTLPTHAAPTLSIRDFGKGLSHEAVFEVFTQYGASTKRNSNEAVGMLGIGSKSGFAYSDTFTITSWYGGKKSIYAAVLDPSDKGLLNLLHQAPCSAEETGIQIQIPVRVKDIGDFVSRASNLFQYFDPQPSINTGLAARAASKRLAAGEIYDGDNAGGQWIALMGCVAYQIDSSQLFGAAGFDERTFERIGGALYFGIGEVQVNASREGLKYGDGTKAAIVKKFNQLVDEYVKDVLDQIKSGAYSPWEKRLRGQVLERLAIKLPSDCKDMLSRSVSIKTPPKTFAIQYAKSITNSISVRPEAVLFIQDDKRAVQGFNLQFNQYVIKPLAKASIAEVQAELDDVLALYEMTGIPTKMLSSCNWTAPLRATGKVVRPKHKARSFKLVEKPNFRNPWSDDWETETERETSPDDVYVILTHFRGVGNFSHHYRNAANVSQALGLKMPTVYGYKSTVKNYVSNCEGTTFEAWYAAFLKTLNNTKTQEMVKHWRQDKANGNGHYEYNRVYDISTKRVESLTQALGENHAITQFAIRILESREFLTKLGLNDSIYSFLSQNVVPKVKENALENEVAKIKKEYPLLSLVSGNISEFWGDKSSMLLGYVLLVDNSKKGA